MRRFAAGALLVVLAATLQAKQESVSTYDPAKFRTANEKAFENFKRKNGDLWRVEWHPVTGTPHLITGYYLELSEPLTLQNIDGQIRPLLLSLQHLLQIEPAQLVLAKADFDAAPKQKETGTWFIHYRQIHGSARVDGASVRLIVRGTRVTSLGSDFFPEVDVAATPSISLDSALVAVAVAEGVQAIKPESTELVVHTVVIDGILHYHLAWAVVLPVTAGRAEPVSQPANQQQQQQQQKGDRTLTAVQWRYVVDAHTGRILDRQNLLVSENVQGRVTGMVVPRFATDTPVERPLRSLIVRARQGGVTHESVTDPGGDYKFLGLLPAAVELQSFLEGPHLRIRNNETPDPDATHNASLTAPATHDWLFNTDDPSPGDVETNAFFHVNEIRDYFLRGDPFDISPTPDPMIASVRAGPYCNAYAGPGGLDFGTGCSTDFASCPDVVYHEYTHRIVDAVYVTTPIFDRVYFDAMNEAWADFFGATIVDYPNIGEACTLARNIDVPDQFFPADFDGAPHQSGRIIAGALWDLRRALGPVYVDSLALRAMKHTPLNYSEYLGAVLAEDDDPVWSTDPLVANNIPADGTPNAAAICHHFYDVHGISHRYCAGHTTRPMAVITSPDPVGAALLPRGALAVLVIGTADGASGDRLDQFVVEYAHSTAPAVWRSVGVALAGGGVAPITEAELARIDAAVLLDGFYRIRLTVQTAGGAVATAFTTIRIDRSLRTGFPVDTIREFVGAAAVADLDPTFPGQEIVATSTFATHAWHHDGSPVAGWPAGPGSLAAPAIADLNADRRLEVVVANSTGVRVFSNTGGLRWERLVEGEVAGNAVIADLDGDARKLEIVALAWNETLSKSTLYAWRGDDGSPVPGFPVEVDDSMRTVPAWPTLIATASRRSPPVRKAVS
jgi:hypothetical protein